MENTIKCFVGLLFFWSIITAIAVIANIDKKYLFYLVAVSTTIYIFAASGKIIPDKKVKKLMAELKRLYKEGKNLEKFSEGRAPEDL